MSTLRGPLLLLLAVPLLSASSEPHPADASWQARCSAPVPSDQPRALSKRAAACELAGRRAEAHRDYAAALSLASSALGPDHAQTEQIRLRLRLLRGAP